MRTRNSMTLLLAFGFYIPVALAADAAITIVSPVGGTKFNPANQIEVTYQATSETNGDHVHLFVDDKKPVVLHQLKGSHTLEPLAPGKHGICVRLVNREHSEIGTQDCVMFRVE